MTFFKHVFCALYFKSDFYSFDFIDSRCEKGSDVWIVNELFEEKNLLCLFKSLLILA